MLTAITRFFDQYLAVKPNESDESIARRVQIAAAVLLIEVGRSDQNFSDPERQVITATMQRDFGLTASQSEELLALADSASRDAYDLYQFTSKIDATFSSERKVQLIEELWRVAYSDSALHEREEDLIRRIANLLHLSHAQFIAAKLRVLANASGGET